MFLLLVAVRNPLVFLQTIGYLLRSLVDRRAYHVYVVNHRHVAQEAAVYGLEIGYPRGLTYAYTASHIIARLKLCEASRDFALQGSTGKNTWRKIFGPVTPATRDLHELAAVVNKTTGTINLASLGVAPKQRRVETLLVFPRYLRCILGFYLMPFRGELEATKVGLFWQH